MIISFRNALFFLMVGLSFPLGAELADPDSMLAPEYVSCTDSAEYQKVVTLAALAKRIYLLDMEIDEFVCAHADDINNAEVLALFEAKERELENLMQKLKEHRALLAVEH